MEQKENNKTGVDQANPPTGDFRKDLAARYPAVDPGKLSALGISSAVELLGFAMAKGAAARLALHLGVTETELEEMLEFTATLAPAGTVDRLRKVEVRTYAMGANLPHRSPGIPDQPVQEKKERES